MRSLATTVLIAAVVFFLLMLGMDVLFQGAPLTLETVMAAFFRTLIFTMIYAALQVGLMVFRDRNK